MAANVGATLTGAAWPVRHAGIGPSLSSAGNTYALLTGTPNTGNLTPMKATNPMSAFTAQTVKLMSSAQNTGIQSASVFQVGDVIHVATVLTTGAIYYNQFSMATDAWLITTSEVAVAAPATAPGSPAVSLVVRSNGEVVIYYSAGNATTFGRTAYKRRTAANTWSAAVAVDPAAASTDYRNPVAVLGASDRVHFFFKNVTSTNSLFQRTLTAANALQTQGATVDSGGATQAITMTAGTSYVDTGVTKVRAFYGRTGTNGAVAMLDSGDNPTVTNSGNMLDNTQASPAIQRVGYVMADGATLHSLYSDATLTDLFHGTSTDGGTTWGVDVNELAGTINKISFNVYTRSGNKVIGAILDDGGTIKYAEISLAAAPQPIRSVGMVGVRGAA